MSLNRGIIINKEIETMIEPLEMVINEKSVVIRLSTRLRNRSMGMVDELSTTNELLEEAADEIDRLLSIIHNVNPVTVLTGV